MTDNWRGQAIQRALPALQYANPHVHISQERSHVCQVQPVWVHQLLEAVIHIRNGGLTWDRFMEHDPSTTMLTSSATEIPRLRDTRVMNSCTAGRKRMAIGMPPVFLPSEN